MAHGKHGQPPTQAKRHYDIIMASGDAFVQRFRSRVNTDGPIAACGGQCHQWTGAKRWTHCEAPSEWYGKIGASANGDKATMRVHRVAWMLSHCRPPPANRWVLHRCHNRLCVNPQHLYLGTHGDNMADLADKRASGAIEPADRAAKKRRPLRDILNEEIQQIKVNLANGATKRSQMRLFNASKFAIYALVGSFAR